MLPLVSVIRALVARVRASRHAKRLARAALAFGPQEYDRYSGLRNGWYSPTTAKSPHKFVVYRNPTTGQEVTITEISFKPTPCNRPPDLVFVGEIDARQYVRGGIYCKH